MKKTEEEIQKIAIEELDKRYGKGAENKTMNKIWLTGFIVGYEIAQNEALSSPEEKSEST